MSDEMKDHKEPVKKEPVVSKSKTSSGKIRIDEFSPEKKFPASMRVVITSYLRDSVGREATSAQYQKGLDDYLNKPTGKKVKEVK